MSEKIDFKKTLDSYRAKRGQFRIVDVPDLQYLMVDGHGDPNTSSAFADAIETLYPVAYKLKFASKQDLGRDYVVPPLEGLWWTEDMDHFTVARNKAEWDWTLMLMVPHWIDRDLVAAAIDGVASKNRTARLDDIRLSSLSEAQCIQTLHVGSFDDEAEILEQMHDDVIPAEGLCMTARHHEIYLSDFRRVAPEKRRTILRQPVAPTTS